MARFTHARRAQFARGIERAQARVQGRDIDPGKKMRQHDVAALRNGVGDDTDSVFHLASIVSAQAEEDFDLGYRVNVDATRALLECCRRGHRKTKFVFTSSIAVFGGPLPDPVRDDTVLTPQGSYGTQK